MTEYCVCGHTDGKHNDVSDHPDDRRTCYQSVEVRGKNYFSFCSCQQFKLDNLKLIEDLATQKGLV